MPDNDLDLKEVKESLEGVNKAYDTFTKKMQEEIAEIKKNGVPDPVTTETLLKLNKEMDKHQEVLDTFAAQQKRLSQQITVGDMDLAKLDKKAAQWAEVMGKRQGTIHTDYDNEKLDEYKAAFDRYLRKDDKILNAEESKALSVGIDPDGGYNVHPDMSGRVVKRQYDTSPVRQHAAQQTISTDALEGTYDLEEAGVGWVGETASRPETTTPQIGVWRIPVHEQYAAPQATQKLVDDSAVDMESWLANKIADKMGRTENTAFVLGTGVAQPRGFMTYPNWAVAGTPELDKIEQFTSGASGAFGGTTTTGDEFMDMIYGLKPIYRQNAIWGMNRSSVSEVRKIKDGDNRQLWQPSAQVGQPATLYGYGITEFEDMADIAGSSLSLFFGDLNAAYQIVDRQGIRVLRDPYTAKPFIIYYTTKRVGGDVIDFEAIKIMAMAA